MRRDEIIAIAEAVQLARKDGESDANRKTGPYISSLEKAVRVLLEFAKDATLSNRWQECSDLPADNGARVDALLAIVESNRIVKEGFTVRAAKAIKDSDVRFLRRGFDEDDMPF